MTILCNYLLPIVPNNLSSKPNKIDDLTRTESGNSAFNIFSPSVRDFIIIDLEFGEVRAVDT